MANTFDFKINSETKTLIIMNRDEATSFLKETNPHELIISITNKHADEPSFEFDGFFRFNDEEKGENVISPTQTRLIKELLMSNLDRENFIIQCDGGVSRSAAVGLAFMILTGNDETAGQMLKCNKFSFNKFVARSFLENDVDLEFLNLILERNDQMLWEE